MIPSGEVQRDERKRTADEVSKAYGRCPAHADLFRRGANAALPAATALRNLFNLDRFIAGRLFRDGQRHPLGDLFRPFKRRQLGSM